MSTIPIYYEQPEAETIEARVVRIDQGADGRVSLVLDRSNFYPEGGGQPCDLGSISGLPLVSVTEVGGEIRHHLALDAKADAAGVAARLKAAGLVPGGTARLSVDLERRKDHSEQHSAQHLLSAILLRMTGGKTLSFHLGETYSSIDSDIAPPDRNDLDAIEDEALRVIRDDYKIITHLCPPEDAAAFPLRKEPTVQTGLLRVIEIDGMEYSACCGTHLGSTAALGAFRLTRAEKYKGGSRLYFVAGSRAYGDYRRLAGLARESAAACGIQEDELLSTVLAYRDRIKALERSLDETASAAANAEALFLDRAGPGTGTVFAETDSFDAASRLARALAKLGRVAVVSCPAELKIASASPGPTEAGARPVHEAFGPLVSDAGGKGGGGKTFFQAAFPDPAALSRFIDAARLA